MKALPAADWTPEQRLLALQENHGLGEEALNAWCRERGLFAHDLAQWRKDFCESAGVAGRREDSDELRQLRLTNMQLQRDLNRKESVEAQLFRQEPQTVGERVKTCRLYLWVGTGTTWSPNFGRM